jgi:hypothetical protein
MSTGKQPLFPVPQYLAPAEIEALRAHRKELHRKFREVDARKAAEKAAKEAPA